MVTHCPSLKVNEMATLVCKIFEGCSHIECCYVHASCAEKLRVKVISSEHYETSNLTAALQEKDCLPTCTLNQKLSCFTRTRFNLTLFLFHRDTGGSPVLAPKSNAAPSDKRPLPLKVNLLQFRKNVSDLRMQLHQMRQLQAGPRTPFRFDYFNLLQFYMLTLFFFLTLLCTSPQLQNQEALRVQLKRAEQEISVKLAEAMRGLEDPIQRQRALVEEDRHKYLGLEERVLTQLG